MNPAPLTERPGGGADLLLNRLVKLAFLAGVARYFVLHNPDTWTLIWTYLRYHHMEIAAIAVAASALVLACADVIKPILVPVAVSLPMILAGCVLFLLKFGTQEQSDVTWTRVNALFARLLG